MKPMKQIKPYELTPLHVIEMLADDLESQMEFSDDCIYGTLRTFCSAIGDQFYDMPFIDVEEVFKIKTRLNQIKYDMGELFFRTRMLEQSENKYMHPTYRERRLTVFSEYGKQCLKCGSIEDVQIDHIKPVSKFPELFLSIGNMQPLCKTCNKQKSNKNENDYRGKILL